MCRPLTLFAVIVLTLAVPSYAASQNSVYLEELTWTEVRDALKAGKTTVIVPTGGMEQKGPHMALGKDSFLAYYNAGEIARRLANALVAPTVSYVPQGDIDPPTGNMRWPGTITLPNELFIQVLVWAGRSFRVGGFTDVVLIGDNGGNQPGLKAAADQLNKEWAGSGVRAHFVDTYYTSISSGQKPLGPFDAWVREQGEKDADVGSHAGIKDTATLMAIEAMHLRRGRLMRWDKMAPGGGFDGSGVIGNPTRATLEYGKKGIELQVDSAVRQIRMLVPRK